MRKNRFAPRPVAAATVQPPSSLARLRASLAGEDPRELARWLDERGALPAGDPVEAILASQDLLEQVRQEKVAENQKSAQIHAWAVKLSAVLPAEPEPVRPSGLTSGGPVTEAWLAWKERDDHRSALLLQMARMAHMSGLFPALDPVVNEPTVSLLPALPPLAASLPVVQTQAALPPSPPRPAPKKLSRFR